MLKVIFLALLEFLSAWLPKASAPKTDEGDLRPEIKAAGASKVKKHIETGVLLIIALWLLAGCNRTVYIPDGSPVRLRQTIKNVDVWVSVNGVWEAGTMNIPEGWYCLYLTEDEINNAE